MNSGFYFENSNNNILNELNLSKLINNNSLEIDMLERNINELRNVSTKEKFELDDMENQINELRGRYEMKKMQIYQLNSKLDEKTKLLNEARKAYLKVFIC